MRNLYSFLLVLCICSLSVFPSDSRADDKEKVIYLGINTADVKEDTSSVQFLNLFRSALPFNETVPWGSSKEVTFDEYGWPNKLNGGKAGTKFLNRLPADTVEDGFFTVLYDGEGEIFYGNDARLVVHRPNKDIIEIRAGKDNILNASLFIKKSNPSNYLRNIRILPEGGVCKGESGFRVKSPTDCADGEYLSFEEHHFNPWAKEQRESQAVEQAKADKVKQVKETSQAKESTKADKKTSKEDKVKTNNTVANKTDDNNKDQSITNDDDEEGSDSLDDEINVDIEAEKEVFVVKGSSDVSTALIFNPEYYSFIKDFQMIRFMNMSGMTRNPVVRWSKRNTLKKATWGGKYGSRGAPVEIMVELSNRTQAYPWFSMPYKANNFYIKSFGKYVNEHLDKDLKSYIEYSNEVWNPIFIHREYAIKQGVKQKLDSKDVEAGYKWYSKRSVQTFKIWEKVFGGKDRLIRVMGGWASNQILSGKLLKYKDAYKHTDAIAIGPYFSALPRVLRRAKTVDDVFEMMLDKKTKWGMESTVNYIKKQAKVAKSYGVDLVAYEGGQHLVDWNTRKVDEHPNPLLYAANRDPRMGILYDELMNEWHRAGGKLFVAFSAPRIYSWYGSWGIKEHIRQARSDAPKYDSLLRYLNARLYPKNLPQPGINKDDLELMSGAVKSIKIGYAKSPQQVWDMSKPQAINSNLKDINPRDIYAQWQANWDTKNIYLSIAVNDDSIYQGDEIKVTFDTTTVQQDLEKAKVQEKKDIEDEKILLEKKKKEKAARKLEYERIARERKEKELALKKAKVIAEAEKATNTSKDDGGDKKADESTTNANNIEKKDSNDSFTDKPEKCKNTVSKETSKNENKLAEKQKSVEEKVKQVKKKASTEETKVNKTKMTKTDKDNEKNPPKESEGKGIKSNTTTEVKEASDSDKKVTSGDDDVATQASDDKTEKLEISKNGLRKYYKDNVITFTFSPFDALNNYSRLTVSDSGYIINAAIPWSEIYYDTVKTDIQMKSGDRLGINIMLEDYDKDEKGNKSLMSADTSKPLPKLILKNILID